MRNVTALFENNDLTILQGLLELIRRLHVQDAILSPPEDESTLLQARNQTRDAESTALQERDGCVQPLIGDAVESTYSRRIQS